MNISNPFGDTAGLTDQSKPAVTVPQGSFATHELQIALAHGWELLRLETSVFLQDLLMRYPHFFASSMAIYQHAGFFRMRYSDSWYLASRNAHVAQLNRSDHRQLDVHEVVHACVAYRLRYGVAWFQGTVPTTTRYIPSVQSPVALHFPVVCVEESSAGIGLSLNHERGHVYGGMYGRRALPK